MTDTPDAKTPTPAAPKIAAADVPPPPVAAPLPEAQLHVPEQPQLAVLPPTTYISFCAEINQQTTETLLGVCGELANKGTQIVYLMLSTPGGGVMHGLTIYNVLRSMPF